MIQQKGIRLRKTKTQDLKTGYVAEARDNKNFQEMIKGGSGNYLGSNPDSSSRATEI